MHLIVKKPATIIFFRFSTFKIICLLHAATLLSIDDHLDKHLYYAWSHHSSMNNKF